MVATQIPFTARHEPRKHAADSLKDLGMLAELVRRA